MNWDEGTGADASLERQVTAQVPLAYGVGFGGALGPGIETAGSRSTGEPNSRSTGVSAAKPPFLHGDPGQGVAKAAALSEGVPRRIGRVRERGVDAILKGNSLAEVKGHLQALWELVEGNPDSEAIEEMVNVLQIALCVEGPDGAYAEPVGCRPVGARQDVRRSRFGRRRGE